MDVINLSDSDDDAASKSSKSSTTEKTETTITRPVNRPGPLSVKMKRMQMTESTSESVTIVEKINPAPLAQPPQEEPIATQTRYKKGKVTEKEAKSLFDDPTSKFLEDFNPETSLRERRKLNRKTYTENKVTGKIGITGAPYDEKGIHRETNLDICDCMNFQCPGCHFPCPSCKSLKCGPTCRCNRKWLYETIEFDGKDEVIKNRLFRKQI